LSVAQHSYLYNQSSEGMEGEEDGVMHAFVYGDVNNLLTPTSAIYNISLKKLDRAIAYFNALPATI
jgi:hypothetical protein